MNIGQGQCVRVNKGSVVNIGQGQCVRVNKGNVVNIGQGQCVGVEGQFSEHWTRAVRGVKIERRFSGEQ